jgi:hypothetical protein
MVTRIQPNMTSKSIETKVYLNFLRQRNSRKEKKRKLCAVNYLNKYFFKQLFNKEKVTNED